MKAAFWQALDRFGGAGAALADWRLVLGDEWEACRHFLKPAGTKANRIIDARNPRQYLDVEPAGEVGFAAIDEDALRPPVDLDSSDVAVMVPGWDELASALAIPVGFAANRWDTTGCCRKIGVRQVPGEPAWPVVLCLPGAAADSHLRLIEALSVRQDALILLPTPDRISPAIDAMAGRNRLELIALSELDLGRNVAVAPAVKHRASRATPRPLLQAKSGWTWEQLQIEVHGGGRVTFKCDGQSKDHRFPKSSGEDHSKGYRILFELAGMAARGEAPEWRNPPSHDHDHEAVRKQFLRLQRDLVVLHQVPGNPFRKEKRAFTPRFSVGFGGELAEQAAKLGQAGHS